MKIGKQQKGKTDLAILVGLANVDERPPPALVLFAAHDGVHSADRAVERNQGAGLALSRFGLYGRGRASVITCRAVKWGALPLVSQSRTCTRETMRTRCDIRQSSRCIGRLRRQLGCTASIAVARSSYEKLE